MPPQNVFVHFVHVAFELLVPVAKSATFFADTLYGRQKPTDALILKYSQLQKCYAISKFSLQHFKHCVSVTINWIFGIDFPRVPCPTGLSTPYSKSF